MAKTARSPEQARKDIHLSVVLDEETSELLDQLRARMGAAAGKDALSHSLVVRLAIRGLARKWDIRKG